MDEQLSLFADLYKTDAERFADRVCDELNSLDTVWKRTFYVEDVCLERWVHVNNDFKTLEISITSPLINDENHFFYLKGDEESQDELMCCGSKRKWIGMMMNDKDFSINPSPWAIYVYYHHFEEKRIDYGC